MNTQLVDCVNDARTKHSDHVLMVSSMDNPTDLDMMLPLSVKIGSFKRVRDGPCIFKAYTVTIQFQNTTIEVDIKEGDPRYNQITEHLISVGRPAEPDVPSENELSG